MTKDKETTKDSETKEPVLTEWQKRNQEFLKKKEQDKAEQEEAEKRLQELRRSQFLGDKSEEKDPKPKSKKRKKRKEKKKKEPKPKKVRKKNPHLNRFITVVLLGIIVLLFSSFMVSPLSTTKNVTVSGHHFTNTASIMKASGIQKDDYLTSVFANRHQIEKAIVKKDPWVKGAKVTFELPNHFNIKVTEDRIIAYRQEKDLYYPILSNGTVVKENVQKLPATYLNVNLDTQKEVKEFIEARNTLAKRIRRNIQSVSKEASKSTDDLIKLTMYDGNTVIVPLSKIKERLPYYSQVSTKLEVPSVIDMEVGIYVTNETADTSEEEPSQASSETPAENANSEENPPTPSENQEVEGAPEQEAETAVQ
ncbi:cell division protein FtsQ/DivIB [Streptococcus jiangjianxini]|uniref:cell division protein FtsQ/DivIB n=1 Tax=Streptococcus jiangjianxini TaxID=3161189 RepID=UPI0032EB680E